VILFQLGCRPHRHWYLYPVQMALAKELDHSPEGLLEQVQRVSLVLELVEW